MKNEINQHEEEYYDIHINKTCSKCYQTKCVTEFYKNKGAHDGYRTTCKNCDDYRQKEYHNENKDELFEQRR